MFLVHVESVECIAVSVGVGHIAEVVEHIAAFLAASDCTAGFVAGTEVGAADLEAQTVGLVERRPLLAAQRLEMKPLVQCRFVAPICRFVGCKSRQVENSGWTRRTSADFVLKASEKVTVVVAP